MYKKPLLLCVFAVYPVWAPDDLRQDILQTLSQIYELCPQTDSHAKWDGIAELRRKIDSKLIPENGRYESIVQGARQEEVNTISQEMLDILSSILHAINTTDIDFTHLNRQLGLLAADNVSGFHMPEFGRYLIPQFAKLFYRSDKWVFEVKGPRAFIETKFGETEDSGGVSLRYYPVKQESDLLGMEMVDNYSHRTPSIGLRTPVGTARSAHIVPNIAPTSMSSATLQTRSCSKTSMAERIYDHKRHTAGDEFSVGSGDLSDAKDSQVTKLQSTPGTLDEFPEVVAVPAERVKTDRPSSKETPKSKQIIAPIRISTNESQHGSPISESASVGSGPDKEKSRSPVARVGDAMKWVASSAASVATSAASSMIHPGKLCKGLNTAPTSDSPELVPEMAEGDSSQSKKEDPFAGLGPMNAGMNSTEIEPSPEPPVVEAPKPQNISQPAPSIVSFGETQSPPRANRSGTRDDSYQFNSEEMDAVPEEKELKQSAEMFRMFTPDDDDQERQAPKPKVDAKAKTLPKTPPAMTRTPTSDTNYTMD